MIKRLYTVEHHYGRSFDVLLVMASNDAEACRRAEQRLGDDYSSDCEATHLEAHPAQLPVGFQIVPTESMRALWALTYWCISGGRYSPTNPYTIPIVERALKAVAKFRGIKDWRDAATPEGTSS